MNERNFWISLAAASSVCALGAGYMIYAELGQIEDARIEVASLRTKISEARTTVRRTPEVEREVIVLREIAGRIREVLPDKEGLIELVRDVQDFKNETKVEFDSFKPVNQSNGRRGPSAFEQVAYQFALKADTFQFLDFLNKIETHSRFMAVSSFKINAASRTSLEEEGVAKHRVQMEVVTYKYVPTANSDTIANISGYERKRDLLAGEIARRRQALVLQTFRYRGHRGRRDPLIDPRVPARVDDPNAWTVQRQMEEVEELERRMAEAKKYWEASNAASSVLERMVQRSELEKILAMLEDDLRRIEREGRINYKPAEKKLTLQVLDPLAELQLALDATRPDSGPTLEEMQVVGDSMLQSIEEGDFDLAITTFKGLEDSLDLVRDDEEREALVDSIRNLNFEAETLRDFGLIEMNITGYALLENRSPVVIIDSKRHSIGDPVGTELIVHDVRPNEVDFVFRGAILTREF